MGRNLNGKEDAGSLVVLVSVQRGSYTPIDHHARELGTGHAVGYDLNTGLCLVMAVMPTTPP